MGLDDFTSGATNTASTTTRQPQSSNEQKDNSGSEPVEEDDHFKVVGNGAKKKVFRTEEEWQEAAEFMENEMDLNPQEVLNMSAGKRHDVLHRAILQISGMDKQPFHPTRNCIVCGETFTFPTNWSFTKFKGEPVCNTHSIQESVEAYQEINKIQG